MKSIVFALTLSLGAIAGTARAQTRDEVCYDWQSQSPGGLLKQLAPRLKAEFKDRKITGKSKERATKCIAGLLPTMREDVVATCAIGGDPADLINRVRANGIKTCLDNAADKPTEVLPADPTEPEPVTPAEEQ